MNGSWVLSKRKLFYIVWAFYSSMYCLFWVSNLKRSYSVQGLLKISNYITVVLLILLFVSKRWFDRREFNRYILLGAIFIGVEIFVSNLDFTVLILFILCAADIDFREFIRFDIKIKLFWLFAILLLYYLGITKNFVGYINGAYKQALGFQHPNTFAMFVLIILLEWLYLRSRIMKLAERLCILLVWFVAMQISLSRTTGYMFLVVYILFILYRYFPKIFDYKIIKILFSSSMPVMTVLSVIITKLYIKGSRFAIELDKIMTHRIRLQSLYWKVYSVQLFGQRINMDSSFQVILDSAYIRCLLSYGIIFTLFLCYFYTIVTYKSFSKGHAELAFLMVFFTVMGFGETSMLRIIMNITFLALLNQSLFIDEETSKGVKNNGKSKRYRSGV